jgi:Protein of unknown function (DUF1064)
MFRRRFKSKYNNRKVEREGRSYDSVSEAKRGAELLEMQKMGLISTLQFQVKFELLDGFKDKLGKKHRPITYIADFVYFDEKGNQIVEDRKGFKDAVYKIKKKMLLHRYPDINFIET